MTVQELIDELNKIEDKDTEVTNDDGFFNGEVTVETWGATDRIVCIIR